MNKIFGDNAMYQFLGMHTEKIVLGLAGVMVLLFIYMGTSQQGLQDDPATLQQQVTTVQNGMNNQNVWETLKSERLPKPDEDFRERSTNLLKPTDPGPYDARGGVPLDPPLSRPQTRREDPEIYPPFDLQAKSGTGALAYAIDPKLVLKLPARQFANPNPLLPQEAQQVIPESFRVAKIMGYRPTDQVELKGVHFVALTALLPYRQQLEEYDITFKQAMGYDARRDTPTYMYYIVQRTEVTSVDEQPAWPETASSGNPKFPIFHLAPMKEVTKLWAAPVPDIVDPKHIDLEMTMQPLPLVLRDLNSFLMHPRVERMKPSDFVPEVQPDVPAPMVDDPLGLEPATPMPVPMNPMPPARNPPVRGPGVVAPPRGLGPGGPGRPFGPGGEGAGRNPGLNPNEPPPEFKLFRFFDTTVVPGKMYKYRVQVWLADANDPKPAPVPVAGGANPPAGDFLPAPAVAHLKDEVIERIKQRRADEAKDPRHRRIDYRQTKWSEASAAIEVPATTVLLAGAVTQAAENEVWRHAEPQGKVVARIFDPEAEIPGYEGIKPPVLGPRDVAGELKVKRSSVINFEEDGMALDPVRLEIEKHKKSPSAKHPNIKKYPFATGATVLDLRGGEKVPLAEKPKDIKEAIDGTGEMLIMDRHGNLMVRSEADDAEDYKDSLLQFEKKGPVLNNNNGPFPGVFPGIPGDGFIPGGEGPRKRGS